MCVRSLANDYLTNGALIQLIFLQSGVFEYILSTIQSDLSIPDYRKKKFKRRKKKKKNLNERT